MAKLGRCKGGWEGEDASSNGSCTRTEWLGTVPAWNLVQAINYIPIALPTHDTYSIRAGTQALGKLETFIHNCKMQQDPLESEGK